MSANDTRPYQSVDQGHQRAAQTDDLANVEDVINQIAKLPDGHLGIVVGVDDFRLSDGSLNRQLVIRPHGGPEDHQIVFARENVTLPSDIERGPENTETEGDNV